MPTLIFIKDADDICFEKYPYLKNSGEVGDTPEKVTKSYRDIGYYLNLISYCLNELLLKMPVALLGKILRLL